MSLWAFPSPQIVRTRRSLEEQPIFSLWTRVKRDIPSTVILNGDGVTWEEYSGSWPGTENPALTYTYGAHGFNTMGSDQSGLVPAARLYIGGHQYIIDDTLKAELVAAVTYYAPSGYANYITAAPSGATYTGDEIIMSGRSAELGQGHAARG